MPIKFFPRAGQLFVCDFTSFREPEMTKKRPVIVISPKLPFRSGIVTVVPISTTAPKHDLPFVVALSRNYHPTDETSPATWAKCDMVTNLSLERLDAFKVGRRKYAYPTLSPEDLLAVREGVIHGLGLGHLLKPADSPK
jgi:mRNA interferase MazF